MKNGETALSHQRSVRGYFYNVYVNRVSGLEYHKFAHGGVEWLPYSPDMNPCDFFLWGYIKDKDHCYSENPTTTV